MSNDSGLIIQLVSRLVTGGYIAHAALAFQLGEDILLRASAIMKQESRFGLPHLIGGDHLELVALLMRDKQLQLYRLLALPLHSMTEKEEAAPNLPTLRSPVAFKEVPFAIKRLPVMARVDERL